MFRLWNCVAFLLLLAVVGCNKDPVGAGAEAKNDAAAVIPAAVIPEVISLSPPTTPAGVGFNVQPDGSAALGIVCKTADDKSVIVFASKPLATLKAKGEGCFITATVPKELFSTPGTYPVYVRNSAGESNRLNFVVRPAQ
jgi:hypothetical protein